MPASRASANSSDCTGTLCTVTLKVSTLAAGFGGGSATLCCTGSGIEPAGTGGSLRCAGELGMPWLAQALSNTLQTKGREGS